MHHSVTEICTRAQFCYKMVYWGGIGLMYGGIWEMGLFDTIVFMFTIYAQPLLRARFLFMAVQNLSQREVGINLYRLFWPCLALDEKMAQISIVIYVSNVGFNVHIYGCIQNRTIIPVAYAIVPRM